MRKKLLIVAIVLATAFAACGGSDDESSGDGTPNAAPVSVAPPDAAHGQELYGGTCAACHGTDAKGIQGLGKDLTDSSFSDELSDVDLVAFIIEGRPAGHELNTTGIEMLPRGGNGGLSDQDLFDIVAYLRSL